MDSGPVPSRPFSAYFDHMIGIRPEEGRKPVPWMLMLTLCERENISRGLAADRSLRDIARELGHAPSTIGREVFRHGSRRKYRAIHADDLVWDHIVRPKPCVLAQPKADRHSRSQTG